MTELKTQKLSDVDDNAEIELCSIVITGAEYKNLVSGAPYKFGIFIENSISKHMLKDSELNSIMATLKSVGIALTDAIARKTLELFKSKKERPFKFQVYEKED